MYYIKCFSIKEGHLYLGYNETLEFYSWANTNLHAKKFKNILEAKMILAQIKEIIEKKVSKLYKECINTKALQIIEIKDKNEQGI
jgi:hypothetical protein